MSIVLDGTTGITNDSGYTGDGVSFADSTPANTLVTTSGGNVGIGTSSPSSYGKFVVADNTGFAWNIGSPNTATATIGTPTTGTATSFAVSLPTHNTYYPASFYISGSHNGSTNITTAELHSVGVKYGGWGSNLALFTSNGTSDIERMRIDSSGNLLVGTTIANAKFEVVKDTAGATAIWSRNTSSVGVAHYSGNTSWSATSDETVKDIIEPITNATEKVVSLRTVIGKYKVDEEGTRRAFLIAQDVFKVLPEAVTQQPDGKLALQYTDTIPLLVAAIQEQQATITALTARVVALEGVQA